MEHKTQKERAKGTFTGKLTDFGRGICRAKVGGKEYFKFQVANTVQVYRETGRRFIIQRYFIDLKEARSFGATWYRENGYPEQYFVSLLES